jgi:DUF1009 family protein
MNQPHPARLGIIAGSGALPKKLLHACDTLGIEPFVVAFKGQTDEAILDGRAHLLTRLGAAGTVVNTLRAHEIRDLVLIGAVRRPSFAELKPDWKTSRFLMRVGMRALGDDGLLQAVRRELEAEGFTLHGVQRFVESLIAGAGRLGGRGAADADQVDIARGIEVSQTLGRLDVGQSVIVQEGIVLGVEGVEGTDALIRRCAALKRKGRGGVLVKTCKPQQDRDLDLPTIGVETVKLCIEAGLSGMVFHAGKTLLIDPQEVSELADNVGLFVIGVDIQ